MITHHDVDGVSWVDVVDATQDEHNELASLPGQVQQVLSKSATEELLEALNRLAPRADGPGGGL